MTDSLSPMAVPFRLPVRQSEEFGTCIVEERGEEVRSLQWVIFMMAGVLLITSLGLIFLWGDSSSRSIVIKGVIVLPLDAALVGFGVWHVSKVSSEARGVRLDPASGDVQLLTVATNGTIRSCDAASRRDCRVAIHPVELDISGVMWHGFALVLHLPSEYMTLACRRHRDELEKDMASLPKWCGEMMAAEDGELIRAGANLRIGGSGAD